MEPWAWLYIGWHWGLIRHTLFSFLNFEYTPTAFVLYSYLISLIHPSIISTQGSDRHGVN